MHTSVWDNTGRYINADKSVPETYFVFNSNSACGEQNSTEQKRDEQVHIQIAVIVYI